MIEIWALEEMLPGLYSTMSRHFLQRLSWVEMCLLSG